MSGVAVYPGRLVLADAIVGHRSRATDAALVTAGTALVALLAQVSIPLWPVPITGQTLGVVIVGAALGARRGAMSLAMYLMLGVMGLPIFADFTGGPAAILKPSFGYIIGFVFAAAAIGWLAERNWDRHLGRSLVGFALASVIPFLFGVPYMGVMLGRLGHDTSFATLMEFGVTPFILGGIIKAVIAAVAVPYAWQRVRTIDAAK